VGDNICLTVNGRKYNCCVAGTIREIPPFPCVYIEEENLMKMDLSHAKESVFINTEDCANEKQMETIRAIENVLNKEGITVSENWNVGLLRMAFKNHLLVIVDFLIVIAIFSLIIGGLCITCVIAINITERKREYGILRSIGGRTKDILQMVSIEVTIMACIGWLSSIVIAIPISKWIGNYFGQIFLHTNLNNTVSISGIMIWLIVVVFASIVAGGLPSIVAGKDELKDTLLYE
jgi:putative ABC transport system permease protein